MDIGLLGLLVEFQRARRILADDSRAVLCGFSLVSFWEG